MSAHMSVLFAISCSSGGVNCKYINVYTVGSVHIDVMSVIDHSA